MAGRAGAVLVVDRTNPTFARQVNAEIAQMKAGARGIVARNLIDRLEAAPATATVRQLGPDESTWHPNDHRGTRSWVSPQDTKIRGAEREHPTDAVVFLHPSRIDPSLSLFRLGTFVHELSFAADLVEGKFDGDFRVREKRASFYRNAWLDSMKLKPIEVSDRVPTPEYGLAKSQGLITPENAASFPIVNLGTAAVQTPEVAPTP